MNKYAVIVAGGKGLRMGEELPKQFIEVHGKPVLMHTIEAFYKGVPDAHLILVLPESHFDFWDKLCKQYNFSIKHTVTAGGETRYHSVRNGLDMINTTGTVAVHDGVRPFVSKKVIENCFECAARYGSAVPVIDLADSIRKIDGGRSVAVDRTDYKLVQTPQVFDVARLKETYKLAGQIGCELFTDDASVFSLAGYDIKLLPGEHHNIKITTPFDLKLAKTIFETNAG